MNELYRKLMQKDSKTQRISGLAGSGFWLPIVKADRAGSAAEPGLSINRFPYKPVLP